MQESELRFLETTTAGVAERGDSLSIARDTRTAKPGTWRVAESLGGLLSIANLPSSLVFARGHSLLSSQARVRFISPRIDAAATFLAIATIAWIPIDIIFFDADWNVVIPLMLGRMAASMLFLAIASAQRQNATVNHTLGMIGLMIGVGMGLYIFAHAIVAESGEVHLAGPGHAQYLLMPIALTVGIALFPLTLIEAGLLMAILFVVFMGETLHHDGHIIWHQVNVAAILMGSVILVAIVCSVSQLKLLIDLNEQSTTDPLTGTLSRRAGVELLDMLFAKSQRKDTPLSLVVIDLDHFKKVNDDYGHDAGDDVLREVARGLKSRLRREDALIRWGGEEFVLVLLDTTADDATRIVAELYQSGHASRPDGSSIQTVSAGLSERQIDNAQDWQKLFEIADSRMYGAKALGRDRLSGPVAISRRLVGDSRAAAAA